MTDIEETDGRPTADLRARHAELRAGASQLAHVAAGLNEWSAPDTPDQLTEIRGFLSGRLLPYCEAEDAVLYPMMDKVMGAQPVTSTMTADHDAIRERFDGFTSVVTAIGVGPPTTAELEALREHLYALWAIIDLHLTKEERILFATLDERLSSADAKTLNEKMSVFGGVR